MAEFRVGDRVQAKRPVERQMHEYGDPDWPAYGHVVNFAQSLVWVRDHLGGEWGLPAHELEHID